MNLHAIVSGAIGAVNPNVTLTGQVSTGFTVNSDYTRTPTYSPVTILGQVQALSYGEVQQLDKLNIQGIRRKVYCNGRFNGVVRSAQEGGDLFQMVDGSNWKIVLVFEYWPDWCSFAMTLQNP